ncbi:MAG: colanic acid biosynthesis glycosyltransferase WcaL [Alphaproteobacteria bacterium]|nr:colanic acid biosynthesis glycosyltransferase WcaL [Alphaproteobacteria bacterium]
MRGLDISIVSLRRPTDAAVHPIHREITAPVSYLPEYLYREPLRVWRAWRHVRRWPTYRSTWQLWWRDFRRDPTPNRGRRFGQALVLAHELDPAVAQVHAHFLHTPASVARYAAALRELPWSASAHAKDIWTTPAWEKAEKLASCQWLVTCTVVNHVHLAALAPPGRVGLAYHGIDLNRFAALTDRRPDRTGSDSRDPIVILSVGRAVAKKGYADLLQALALLPQDLHWRFVHVGGGRERPRLRRLAAKLAIADRIEWRGALPQDQLLPLYRAADLFVLASRVADDGDRDGLPNVLMEALSQELPCVSTAVSAIPELIDHQVHGTLVEPAQPPRLAEALQALIGNPALRRRLALAGAQRVRQHFSMTAGIDQLADRFGLRRRQAAE